MESKKKILIIGYTIGIGGVEKAMTALINSIDYTKTEVDVMLFDHSGEFLTQLNSNARILPLQSFQRWIMLPKHRVIQSISSLLFSPKNLYFFLKNLSWGLVKHNMAQGRQRLWRDAIATVPALAKEYDEVLDFSGLFRRYALCKVKAKVKKTWIHSDYRVFGYDKNIDYTLLKEFDQICCVSETVKDIFDSEFPDLACKSVVELNKIDLNYILSKSKEGGFNDDFKGVRLLDVTRIDPNKGLDIAVEVCARLKASGLNFRWYILGNDPLGYRKELEQIIREKNVEDCFILLGFTTNPYSYMDQADIIVHFSRFEGRSVSIDEALALGKTIMLTNYPTAKDQITDGVNGHICDFDEDHLTNQLKELITQARSCDANN